MRRSTRDCLPIGKLQRSLAEALGALDAETTTRMTAALEPFVTIERRERVLSVIGRRLGSVTVLMDAPHDPHNGAAVLRTCDAFGIQRLHVVERRESFLAARSVARGSERWVDVATYRYPSDAIERLREDGFTLLATHPDGALVPEDLADRADRVALVLGSERDGIGRELADACDRAVRIPMRGFVESLNVSVTASIVLHSLTGSRTGDLAPAERAHLYLRALVLTLPHAPTILAASGFTAPEIDPLLALA